MEKFMSLSDPIKPTLREMQVGNVVHFPVSKMSVIRTLSSVLGFEMNRKYTAKHNHKMKTAMAAATRGRARQTSQPENSLFSLVQEAVSHQIQGVVFPITFINSRGFMSERADRDALLTAILSALPWRPALAWHLTLRRSQGVGSGAK